VTIQHFRGSVGITVFRDGKVLAVKNRKWGSFSCPGGKLEQGETPEQGARRELLEETGCEAISIRHIAGAVHNPMKHDPEHVKWFCTGFIADIGDQEPRSNEDMTGAPYWTTIEDMRTNALFPQWYEWWFDLLARLGELPKS
jgi:8-oxo-dGTP diphosphatase